jgi:tetratricopeptide (TPR) repeat protein
MFHPRVAVVCGGLLLAGFAGGAAWWWFAESTADPTEESALPVPPFPPRVAEDSRYETCLSSLAEDPDGAITMADSLEANGGGDAAAHCRGLALMALGQPEDGAAVLEALAKTTQAPPLAKASVLYQAAQARLMVGQSAQGRADATAALALSPDDVDLMIIRASAEDAQGAYADAVHDLDDALEHDSLRTDALVARATLYRKQGHADLALQDVATALKIDPDDADALLERGILRQRAGDLAGAREDWEHARGADPDSTTADLADQNLALLAAGPSQQ